MTKPRRQAKSSKVPPVPPDEPLCPGDVLRRMIVKGKKSSEATIKAIESLAKKIPCSSFMIEAIIYFNHYITPTMAKRLEKHVGLTADDWLKLNAEFRAFYKDQLPDAPDKLW